MLANYHRRNANLQLRATEFAARFSGSRSEHDPGKVQARREAGRLPAEERLVLLFDPDSFTELFPNVPGIIAGSGTVHGKLAFAVAWDYLVKAGACDRANGIVAAAVVELAREARAPIVMLNESSGALIHDGILSLGSYQEIFTQLLLGSGVHPRITVLFGSNAGGAAYGPAMMDFIIMSKGSAAAVTGPDAIKKATGAVLTMEQLGGAEVHGMKSGRGSLLAGDEPDAIAKARALIAMLPRSCWEYPEVQLNGDADDRLMDATLLEAFHEAVTSRRPFEIRRIISDLVDRGPNGPVFFEVWTEFARNLVTGFARLGGQLIGIVANNKKFLAAALDPNGCKKGARFVRFCDRFHVPVLTLVDVTGVFPDPQYEVADVLGFGSSMLQAYTLAHVPTFSLLVYRAFGGAWCIMGSGLTGARSYAWPWSGVAVMGAEQAVPIVYKRELADIRARDGEAAAAARQAELVAHYAANVINIEVAREAGYIETVIETPAHTRLTLIRDIREAMATYRENPAVFRGELNCVA